MTLINPCELCGEVEATCDHLEFCQQCWNTRQQDMFRPELLAEPFKAVIARVNEEAYGPKGYKR